MLVRERWNWHRWGLLCTWDTAHDLHLWRLTQACAHLCWWLISCCYGARISRASPQTHGTGHVYWWSWQQFRENCLIALIIWLCFYLSCPQTSFRRSLSSFKQYWHTEPSWGLSAMASIGAQIPSCTCLVEMIIQFSRENYLLPPNIR